MIEQAVEQMVDMGIPPRRRAVTATECRREWTSLTAAEEERRMLTKPYPVEYKAGN